MSDVLEILKRGDSGLDAMLRAVLLDSENKVPADRLRIVGALSAGAIIEQGENANGEYVRFANGLQICRFSSGRLGASYATSVTVTFPAVFSEGPVILPAITIGAENIDSSLATSTIYAVKNATTTTTSCTIAAQTLVGGKLYNGEAKLIAIGRWKA